MFARKNFECKNNKNKNKSIYYLGESNVDRPDNRKKREIRHKWRLKGREDTNRRFRSHKQDVESRKTRTTLQEPRTVTALL